MKKNQNGRPATSDRSGQIQQSNISDFLNFFGNDKEKVQKILDEFFLTWSYYEGADSGLVRDEFNKYTHAYVFLKRIVASMQIEKRGI